MAKDLFASVRGKSSSPKGRASRESLKEIQELVGELRPDDGVDPRLAARQRRKQSDPARPGHTHGEHKQAQLFSQVKEAIDGALLGARNPVLNALSVVDVTPTGGSLAVVVQPRDPGERVDPIAAAAALEAARSMLRREIAASISRKETPSLQFVVLPAQVGEAGE